MILHETPRARILVFAATLIAAAALGLLLAHQVNHVHAAKLAVTGEDIRIYNELAALPAAPPNATPVLVELFTSEGCSSCPPADALLARLQHDQPVPNAEILALEEHVDYWDSLGWHDRFSSHQITQRQSVYAQRLRLDDNYTPQMIVDGTSQFVGNDSAQALRAIAQAARAPKLTLTLSPVTAAPGHLAGAVSAAPSSTRDADLYAALVEPMDSTQVQSGENGGRTLHHVSVVRSLQRIGSLADATSAPLQFSLAIPKDAANLRIVVFAQRANQGAVLGAVSSPTADAPVSTPSNVAAENPPPQPQ